MKKLISYLMLSITICSTSFGGLCGRACRINNFKSVQTTQFLQTAIPNTQVFTSGYHSVGSELYQEALNDRQVKQLEAVIAKAFQQALQNMENGKFNNQPPATPNEFRAFYKSANQFCASCHGEQPKGEGNNFSLTKIYQEEGVLMWKGKEIPNTKNSIPEAVRLSCIQKIDSGEMPKGQNLGQQQIEPLFNEFLYGGSK